jgi:hypothetical protein
MLAVSGDLPEVPGTVRRAPASRDGDGTPAPSTVDGAFSGPSPHSTPRQDAVRTQSITHGWNAAFAEEVRQAPAPWACAGAFHQAWGQDVLYRVRRPRMACYDIKTSIYCTDVHYSTLSAAVDALNETQQCSLTRPGRGTRGSGALHSSESAGGRRQGSGLQTSRTAPGTRKEVSWSPKASYSTRYGCPRDPRLSAPPGRA